MHMEEHEAGTFGSRQSDSIVHTGTKILVDASYGNGVGFFSFILQILTPDSVTIEWRCFDKQPSSTVIYS